MGGPPSTPNVDESKIPKARVQQTTTTTDKPIHVLSTKNYKEEKKRPGRCGNHNGYINPHGTISIRFHQQYTGTIKTKEGYPRDKEAYAR